MTTHDKDDNHLLFSWLLLMVYIGWQSMNFKLLDRKGTLCSCVEMVVSSHQSGIKSDSRLAYVALFSCLSQVHLVNRTV